jgi:ABC-type antimicrobial peptide transport system permease subunit
VKAILAAAREARHGLAQRRRRVLINGLGIALAAAMLSAAAVLADGLGLGFDRAVRAAQLPDVIVRFDPQPIGTVARRILALPDIAGFAARFEVTGISVAAPGHEPVGDAVAEVLGVGGVRARRGYAIVAGRGLHGAASEVLVEKAFADAWGLRPGSLLFTRGLGTEHVVGLVEAPDNVGYPLAKPRFYLSAAQVNRRFGADPQPRVNLAEVWLRDPRYLSEVLVQARDTSFGLRNIRFATRAGVRVLLDQAAGIVIDLLVALSVIALVTAGVLLAASARAEVQRRLGAIGIRRAVGEPRGQVVLAMAFEAALVAVPAATIGLAAGTIAILGATNRLLTLLNETAPGSAFVPPLVGVWALSVLLPTLGAAWPAFVAAGGNIVSLLRGAGLTPRRARPRRSRGAEGALDRPGHPGLPSRPGRPGRPGLPSRPGRPGRRERRRPGWRFGLVALGVRLAAARRARLVATIAMLSLSSAFVLLMIALAAALSALATDPTALGRRYQLTAVLPPSAAAAVRRIPGVAAVTPRYDVVGADSFSLGEAVDIVGYGGNHARFEAPPLISGSRLQGCCQAEVGIGLANALGLSQGSELALALPSGRELRLRVSGIVSSLDYDGRVAYVPASALLAADPGVASQLVIVLKSLSAYFPVYSRLLALGATPTQAAGATARGAPLVDVLRTILRAVAIVDGLVCLYALIQACTLTVQERRRSIAVLRAGGAGADAVRRLLLGAAACLVLPAAVIGVALERFVFGPELTRLAINYATLDLTPALWEVAAVVGGLVLFGALAAIWVARQAVREPVVAGLSR